MTWRAPSFACQSYIYTLYLPVTPVLSRFGWGTSLEILLYIIPFPAAFSLSDTFVCFAELLIGMVTHTKADETHKKWSLARKNGNDIDTSYIFLSCSYTYMLSIPQPLGHSQPGTTQTCLNDNEYHLPAAWFRLFYIFARFVMILERVSLLDCLVFLLFLAPQLIFRIGFFRTFSCGLRALPFLRT